MAAPAPATVPAAAEKAAEKPAEKPAKKRVPKADADKNKKKKKPQYGSFATYIYKVLRQVHPDTGITKKSMLIMDSFVHDILERLAREAGKLARYNKRLTITSREIQTAVRLALPGELAKHAVSEGTKAVTKFGAARAAEGDNPEAPKEKKAAKPKGEKAAKSKAPKAPKEKKAATPKADAGPRENHSRSFKAGLQFPVGRIHSMLKNNNFADRISATAPIYLAAVLEYLTAEILELAGNAANENKRIRIIPRYIQLAVRNDEELNKLLHDVTISSGGVLPNIHSVLLPPQPLSDDEKAEKKAAKAAKAAKKPSAGSGDGFYGCGGEW